jgi:hypothetical protein
MREVVETLSNWFLWWQLGPVELAWQVENYGSAEYYKVARGIAVLCIAAVVAIDALYVSIRHFNPETIYDPAIFVALAIFIHLGQRWAMLGAMIFWTLVRLFAILRHPIGVYSVNQLVWWCVFMHIFYLAYRVESIRRRQPSMDIRDGR